MTNPGLPQARYLDYLITGPSGGFYSLHPLTRVDLLTEPDSPLTGYLVPEPAAPTLGGRFVKLPML